MCSLSTTRMPEHNNPLMPLTLPHILLDQLQHHVPSALVLTAFVTIMAYVRSLRAKALIYSLPVPFSCAYMATQLPINATHLTGLALVAPATSSATKSSAYN